MYHPWSSLTDGGLYEISSGSIQFRLAMIIKYCGEAILAACSRAIALGRDLLTLPTIIGWTERAPYTTCRLLHHVHFRTRYCSDL